MAAFDDSDDAPPPSAPQLLRDVSAAYKAGLISSEDKGRVKDVLLGVDAESSGGHDAAAAAAYRLLRHLTTKDGGGGGGDGDVGAGAPGGSVAAELERLLEDAPPAPPSMRRRLSQEDREQMREERAEEVEALEAIYEDDFRVSDGGFEYVLTLRPTELDELCCACPLGRWKVGLPEIMAPLRREDLHLTLRIYVTEQYPITPPVLELLDPHAIVPQAKREALQRELDEEAAATDICMAYTLGSIAQDRLQEALEEKLVAASSRIVVDGSGRWEYVNNSRKAQLLRDEAAAREARELSRRLQADGEDDDAAVMRARATARSDEDWRYEALRRGVPPLALQGADIGAFFQWFVHDGTRPLHPGLFVGLATVFRALRESGFGVLSIENIMREDLAVKFLHHWMELAERYGSRRNRNVHPPSRSHRRGTVRWPYQGGCGAFTWRAGDAEPGAPCAQPIMAFHGTQQHRFASIVRNGLVVPGRNVGHRHDAGYYGRGIYVSPDAGTSAGYAAGNSQLIVCATLLGNAYVATQSRNMYGAAKMQDYDSHTSEDGWNELVLFRNEQVLPCWMVTFCALDARPEIVKGDVHTIADSGTIYKTGEQYAGASNADGVAELSREELQRRAAFWFTSLDGKKKRQILEVAEPDDDDDTVSGFDRGTVDLERDGVLLEDGEHALHRQLPRGFGDDRW